MAIIILNVTLLPLGILGGSSYHFGKVLP